MSVSKVVIFFFSRHHYYIIHCTGERARTVQYRTNKNHPLNLNKTSLEFDIFFLSFAAPGTN